jgi:hypothetical protein
MRSSTRVLEYAARCLSTAGNYGFFNWLTLVLLVPLVDDSAWNALCKSAEVAERREVAAAAAAAPADTRARLLVSVRFAAMRMRCASLRCGYRCAARALVHQDEWLLETEKTGGSEGSASARAQEASSARRRRTSARAITIGMDENEPLLVHNPRQKEKDDREASEYYSSASASAAAAKVTPAAAAGEDGGGGGRLLGAVDRSTLLSSAVAVLAVVGVAAVCVLSFGLRLDSRVADGIEAPP